MFRAAAETIGKGAEPLKPQETFYRLARLADYKLRNRKNIEPFDYSKCPDPDKNSVTLCGVCIGTNQLGNIMYGIIAVVANLEDFARSVGRKLTEKPWTEQGQGYRQNAFELGVDFQKNDKDKSKESFCNKVKASEKKLNGAEFETDACKKKPCDEKHTGPNTYMKRSPISDTFGN